MLCGRSPFSKLNFRAALVARDQILTNTYLNSELIKGRLRCELQQLTSNQVNVLNFPDVWKC